jgi:hypothetical protein
VLGAGCVRRKGFTMKDIVDDLNERVDDNCR